MKKRLSLDIGATSIGWCLLDVSEKETPSIIDMGVRIWKNGDKKERSEKRSERIQKMRRRMRSERLKKTLDQNQNFLEQSSRLSMGKEIYELRTKALDSQLTPLELRSVLFHLANSRGFRSNKKSLLSNDDSKFHEQITQVSIDMKKTGARTYGELLFKLSRKHPNAILKTKGENPHRSSRAMIIDEFDQICKKQQQYYPDLPWIELKNIIFFQRELKEYNQGHCSIYTTEKRLRKSSYLARKFSILQTLSNLNVREKNSTAKTRRLDKNELQDAYALLVKEKKITPEKLGEKLSLEIGYIHNDIIEGLSEKDLWAETELSDYQKEHIIDICLDADSEEEIESKLHEFKLSEKSLHKLFKYINSLPKGYLHLSEKACREAFNECFSTGERIGLILDKMRSKKCIQKSDQNNELDYYGKILGDEIYLAPACNCLDPNKCMHSINEDERRYGKSPNNILHNVLNQLRKLVNAIINRYGKCDEVVVEVVRNILSEEDKRSLNKKQTENKKANEEITKELEAAGIANTKHNKLKEKLYQEMGTNPCCVICQKRIGKETLHSDNIEIDHIIPRSVYWNDSISNKMLLHRECNRKKGGKTPYDAFGSSHEYSDIERKVSECLPKHKHWRFESSAIDQHLNESEGFLPRHLTDTAYATKIALQYLKTIFNEIWAVRGSATHFIRHMLDLRKDREDHRHHATDAFCLGLIDRSMVQRLSYYEKNHTLTDYRAKFELVSNQKQLLEQFNDFCEKLLISIRPRHAIQNPIFEATAYGINKTTRAHKKIDVQFLKEEIDIPYNSIPREIKKGSSCLINLNKPNKVSYESIGSAYVDVWLLANGKWELEFFSWHDAYIATLDKNFRPNNGKGLSQKPQKKLMRLTRGDCLSIGGNIYTITTIIVSGECLKMIPLYLSSEQIGKTKKLSASGLKKHSAHKVYIDVLGKTKYGIPCAITS